MCICDSLRYERQIEYEYEYEYEYMTMSMFSARTWADQSNCEICAAKLTYYLD